MTCIVNDKIVAAGPGSSCFGGGRGMPERIIMREEQEVSGRPRPYNTLVCLVAAVQASFWTRFAAVK